MMVAPSARRLLQQMEPASFPLRMQDVCSFLNIELRFCDCGEIDAFLIPGTSPLIVVNDNRPVTRQRFSIAHELGHFILGHVGGMQFSKEGKGCNHYHEVEANRFAGELLMPKNAVYSTLGRPITVQKLMNAFNVSKYAAKIRLEELGEPEL